MRSLFILFWLSLWCAEFVNPQHVDAAETILSGNCNIIIQTLINSHVSITNNCKVFAQPSDGSGKPNLRNMKKCGCATQRKFVRQLEEKMIRMNSGIGRVPSYRQAYDMLTAITHQVPACCYKPIVDEIIRSREVACKIKLVSNIWMSEPENDVEEITELAARKFRIGDIEICNNLVHD